MSDIFVIKSYKPLMIGNSFLRSFKGLGTETFTSSNARNDVYIRMAQPLGCLGCI